MGKTVYSIVLSQHVVEQIDTLAVQKGVSRSALINHILAQHAGLSTPEGSHQALVDIVRRGAAGGQLRAEVSSAGKLTLYTALRYKYNPALRYQLQFLEEGPLLCELQVTLRSQNEELLSYLSLFFELWGRLEQKYLVPPPPKNLQSTQQLRYRRRLRRPAVQDQTLLGQAVADYLSTFDACLKTYFSHLGEARLAVQETEKTYLKALPKNELLPFL